MIGDRADAMLEDMDETRHEGKYRRIEVITGRRQRRNWTDEEKARILAESAEPDVNISAVARRWGVNRGLLNVWRRDAGLDLSTICEVQCAAGDVRAGDGSWRSNAGSRRAVRCRPLCRGSN
ncbi:Transposase [Brucella anthropi]|nr:Transposase [Brucella anthropi]